MKFDKSYFKKILDEAPLNLGRIDYPSNRDVIAIQKKLRADAPEILKQYRKLVKELQSSSVYGKEIVYIRDNPSESYRKKTGFGDAHRIVIRDRTKSPLGKEVVYHQSPIETTYDTVLAIKEEYIPEAIYKKKIGAQGVRDIKKGTPPYTVVAMKGKKVVAQSKPAMVSSQVPAIIYDFLAKHGKDDSLTIGVEDKGGELVYTYYKPFGEEYIPEGTWAFPDKPATIKKLKKLLKKPVPVGVNDYNDPVASKDGVESKLKGIIGDDELFDRFDALRKRKGPKADARPAILKWLKKNDVQVEMSAIIKENVELKSVGTYFDTKNLVTYPMQTNNKPDMNSATDIEDISTEWVKSLSKNDLSVVRKAVKKNRSAARRIEDALKEDFNQDVYEGGMGNEKEKARLAHMRSRGIPTNDEIKDFYEKQKGSSSQRIAATKKHFNLQKMTVSAKGNVATKGIRVNEGGLDRGAHKMAKGRIGVSPSHAKKYRDSLGKGSKFEPSKDRDKRGGQWDGDNYTMSKKDYARLHKDFKSKIKGKPYATTMDPKTGATILTPVIITEKRGAEDPYTVKYWYDKQGRKMWATLSGEADAKKFLKNVKGLGMGGMIIKGDVREETIAVTEYRDTPKTKQAKFAQGNRPGDASDPYTVKYSYTKTGRIMVATLASKKDAQMFLRNVKGLGMNGIIVKGVVKEEFAAEALKQKFSHGNLPIKDHDEERKFKEALRSKFSETPNACSKQRHEESATVDDDIDERAGANRLGGVLMVRTMKQDDGSYKWILQRVEGSPGAKAKTTEVDSGIEDSRSKADRAGQKAKKKMKTNEEYIADLKEAVDKTLVDELVLYITNDGQLYRQRTQSIIKNLSKKVGDTTYDGLKAIKAFMYLVTDGIKKYEKEHAGKGWAKSINKETKQAIAEALLDYYTEEIGENKKR